MMIKVPGAWFENVLKIAGTQFRADAALARECGDTRTMDAFLLQAEQCEQLLTEVEGDRDIRVVDERGIKEPRREGDLRRMTYEARKYKRCQHCSSPHADHVDYVKCPFSSTIFQEVADD